MPYSYSQTVYDAFPGSTLNTGLWTDESQNTASGQIAVSGGILSLQAKSNYEVEVDATHYFDATSGLWAVKWGHTGTGTADTSGDGTAGTECYFGFADAANNYFELQVYPASNTWYPWNATNNGQYSTGTGNQNAFGSAWTSGQWIGIGDFNVNGDNRLHVYSSPDGVTWTEIASWVVSGPINMTAVELFLGTYQHTGSSTWVSQFHGASTFIRSGSSGGGGGTSGGSHVPSPPILGMYETGGNFPTPGPSAWPSGPTTNLTATYVAWGQDIPTYVEPFVNECNNNGLTPFVELEPWNSGPSWNVTPLFSSITGGTWDSWLEALGTFIASTGKPCILTFAHEFNVSGQYPWSQGDTGSGPGGGTLTPSEWIAGWNYVRAKVNSTAGGLAVWMWACSAFTGGTNVSPAPWWPGSANVDMVGIDGYPNTQYGSSLGTFAGQIQPTVTIIRGLGWGQPIFLSETNLAGMVASGGESITSFVADMYNAGMSGILEFEDASWGEPEMTSAQWTQYNNAVAAHYGGGGGGGGTGGGGTAGSLPVTPVAADEVSSSSGVAHSVTSFSPSAGSQVRICATWLNATDLTGKTFTCADSHGNSYTETLAGGDADGGCYLLVFDHVYATAPGATTVTITCSNTAAADCLIQPYLIAGQAADQSTAAHNSYSEAGTATTTYEISLTTTVPGSVVWVLGAPNNNNHPVPVAISGTTTDVDWDDDNVGSHGVIGRSTNPTGTPGPTTFGWTSTAQSIYGYGVMASEVIPAAGSGGGLLMVGIA